MSGCLQINIFLLLCNLLLPAYPLDGARVMVDSLLLLGASEAAAALITVACASAVGVGLCIYAFYATHIMAALVRQFTTASCTFSCTDSNKRFTVWHIHSSAVLLLM
jgi:Zn-dependent protease